MRCDERHAHEDITRDQLGNKAAGERTVFPGVDGDKIRGRGQREEAVFTGDVRDFRAGCGNHRADAGQVIRIGKGGQSAGLTECATYQNDCGILLKAVIRSGCAIA